MLSLFVSRTSCIPSVCQSATDLTLNIYNNASFEANVPQCFKVRGSIFVGSNSQFKITGYIDDKLEIPENTGIAAVFKDPDLAEHDYYFVLESTTDQNNITLCGCIDVPSNQKVLITTQTYYDDFEDLLEDDIRAAHMYIIGDIPSDYSITLVTDDNARVDCTFSEDGVYENLITRRSGGGFRGTYKPPLKYIELHARSVKDDDNELSISLKGPRQQRQANGLTNDINGYIRIRESGVLNSNDFKSRFTDTKGLTHPNSLNGGEIAGIVIAVIVVIVIIVVIIICCCCTCCWCCACCGCGKKKKTHSSSSSSSSSSSKKKKHHKEAQNNPATSPYPAAPQYPPQPQPGPEYGMPPQQGGLPAYPDPQPYQGNPYSGL